MLTKTNELGTISITNEVIIGITSIVAKSCFGISGMESKNASEEFWGLFTKDSHDRGIGVLCDEDGISIDLHIMVVYGINIPAITDSIVHKIKYTVEELSGFPVKNVNVYVDKVTDK